MGSKNGERADQFPEHWEGWESAEYIWAHLKFRFEFRGMAGGKGQRHQTWTGHILFSDLLSVTDEERSSSKLHPHPQHNRFLITTRAINSKQASFTGHVKGMFRGPCNIRLPSWLLWKITSVAYPNTGPNCHYIYIMGRVWRVRLTVKTCWFPLYGEESAQRGLNFNFLSREILFEKMAIKIIVSESWKLEANWEHEGANVTQIILYPAGKCCPFMMDHGKLFYDRPWLNWEDACGLDFFFFSAGKEKGKKKKPAG